MTNTPLVTRDLALRLEAAEAAYGESKLRALQADDGNSRGVEIACFGRAIVLSIQSRRHNPSNNRVLCFSSEDEKHLDDILRWLRDRDVQFWFDVVPTLVNRSTLTRLGEAGLSPAFLMNVVYTVPRAVGCDPDAGIAVEQIDLREPDRRHDFTTVLCAGFGVPGEASASTERAVEIEYAAPEWRVYLASIDGTPASMAALHVQAGLASIDAMATVPGLRNRGCQTTLLRRCVRDAARAGCALLASQTESGSGSERNMVRAGFRIAYTKALYSEQRHTPD